MENTTDADKIHTKIVFKDFERKKLGGYDDLCLKGDTLLLADVFKTFKKSIWKSIKYFFNRNIMRSSFIKY